MLMITNAQSGTNVHEVADGIYRINTPVSIEGAGRFNFNQYLVADDEPLLFHTGPRQCFALVQEAVASILPVETLRHVALSHFEADECGSLNGTMPIAPRARSPTATCWRSDGTRCVGSTRRTCRMHGSAA
jgi:flavorubredoxin